MGVDNSNALAVLHVVDDHVAKEGGFTGTRFTNDVHMAAAVFVFDAKNLGLVFEFGFGKEVDLFAFLWRSMGVGGEVFRRFPE